MLFLPPGTSRLQRVHAPFVTEAEIAAVVGFLEEPGRSGVRGRAFSSRRETRRAATWTPRPADGDDNDELFDDAVRLVLRVRQGVHLLATAADCGSGTAALPT